MARPKGTNKNVRIKEVGDFLEHHQKMDKAMDRIGKPRSKHSDPIDAIKIFDKALQAGTDALKACIPTPMVVQLHKDVTDDHSDVIKSYHISDGVCSFAWINIKLTNIPSRQFINALKKAKLATADINSFNHEPFKKSLYYGGYMYWIHQGNQSMQKKEAFARAFAAVLINEGIKVRTGSRMD